MNINKGQEKTSILLFFLKSSLKTFDSGKTKKCPTYLRSPLFEKKHEKSSSRSLVTIQQNIYMWANGKSKNFLHFW